MADQIKSSDPKLRAQPIKITVPVSSITTPEGALNLAIGHLVEPGFRAIINSVTVEGFSFPVEGRGS